MVTPFPLPPVPKEPIGESHIWRDWLNKLQAIASGALVSSIVTVPTTGDSSMTVIDISSADERATMQQISESLLAILVESRVTNHLLQEGLNVTEDLNALREDIFRDITNT